MIGAAPRTATPGERRVDGCVRERAGPAHRPARTRASTTPSPTCRACSVGHTTLISGDGPLVVGAGARPDRGHGRRPARGRRLDRARVRRLPPAQRQRRADRPRVGPRVGAARRRHRDHQHPLGRRRPRRARRPRGARRTRGHGVYWSLPVVGETYDGALNDINGFHVRPSTSTPRSRGAHGGPVARGERRRRDAG